MAFVLSQVLVISDEVYKYMAFGNVESTVEDNDACKTIAVAEGQKGRRPLPPKGHISFSTLPDMSDRTISISSAGKTFSVTGWQVPWIAAGALYYASRAKAEEALISLHLRAILTL